MKIQTRSITLAATMAALCCATYMIPFVFFIPVTVAATTLSLGLTVFVGLAFGAISVAYSFLFPTGLVATAFVQAPYIAILPRVIAAMGAFGIYKLITYFLKPQKKSTRAAAISVSAATGSILNTALVVGMMVLIMPTLSDGSQTVLVYSIELIIRGAIECVCMALLTPPITLTLEKAVLHRGAKKPTKPALISDGGETTTDGADNAELQVQRNEAEVADDMDVAGMDTACKTDGAPAAKANGGDRDDGGR